MEKDRNPKKHFSYRYSARDQAELRRIRRKYASPTETEDKMERLRDLDASVTRAAEVTALVLGIMGAMLLALGLMLCMTSVGDALGLHGGASVAVGIICGVLGGGMALLAYPAYCYVTEKRKAEVSPEILRLLEELSDK